MDETCHRYYRKEEEFFEEYGNVANAAMKLLGDEWRGAPNCDDALRKNREYFFSTGDQKDLVFDGAAVYHTKNGRHFSSAQIVLKSVDRLVNVRVRKVGNDLVAEMIIERPNEDKTRGHSSN